MREKANLFFGRFVFLATLMATAISPPAYALNSAEKPSDYIVGHWDTEDGLPHNSIKQLFQTSDGYLWIGTQQGLARFDGLSFTVFNRNNTPAMVNNLITSMAQTVDGSLWIGTNDNLVRYHDGIFTAYTQADGLKDRTINTLCVAADGSLWIGGREGVTRWVGGKFVTDIDTSSHSTAGMRNITVDRQKNMWLAVGTEALRYKDGTLTAFGREEGLPGQQLQIIAVDADGRILAITQNGLFRLEDEKFVPLEQNAALSSPRISRTLLDRDGNLWIGSANGLDRLTAGTVVPYTDRYGHKFGVVDALIEDREGCVWAGTSEGLYRLTDRRASSLTEEDGIPGSLVLALKETRDGSLWVSSWGAGVARFKNGAVTHLDVNAPLSHETVTALYEGADGVMWLGNRGSSVDRLENGRVTTFVYQSGVATSRPVTALFGEEDGSLLVGIGNRGLFQLRNGEITAVPEASSLAKASIWSFHRMRDGRLLIGTSLGVFQREANRNWLPVFFPPIKSTVIVRAFLEEEDSLWLATDGNGLVRWKQGEARTYDSHRGMLDDTLFSVLDDARGSLWVSSARGLGRIEKSEFAAVDRGAASTVSSVTFGRLDGLASASTSGSGNPAAIRLTDGRLLTGTDKGVAVIDPRLLQINSQPPAVVIESVYSDDQPLSATAKLNLAAGSDRLEIRYTALSLIAPQRLRFRYKLEGSDVRWVEAGHDRRAHYTNLPPGDYIFRVLACNNDGVWSDHPASLAFKILPHFYQTAWFRAAGLGALIALVTALFWWRGHQLSKRQKELKRANIVLDQRVRERTAELSRSHEELQQRELLFRLIFEHAPVGISWKRTALNGNYHFNPTFCRILDLPSSSLPDFSVLTAMLHAEDVPRQQEKNKSVESGGSDNYTIEQRYLRKDGKLIWGMLSVAVVRDQQGHVIQEIGILEDVTARKNAERELADTYKNLVDVSRTAGMAEVATGVLHNVGNVLNSLNVSASVIAKGLQQSKAESLSKLSALLQEHAADLAAFLTVDPKGKRVPEYIDSLSKHFIEERTRLLAETASLQHNVDHIKEVVSMQQAYATTISIAEPLDPSALVEDALRMNSSALTRHEVSVTRDFKPVGPVLAEKAKVIQILINLISNAKHACDGGSMEKTITVGIEPGTPGQIRLFVRDNGTGIRPENLSRIFAHGFTTKANGHGFGLHSAANAAKEMKGSLTAQSEGEGRGATFTLELPAAGASPPSPRVA